VWGAGKYLHLVLISTLVEVSGELHNPTALPIPGKEQPAHIVGPRDGLDVLEKEKSVTRLGNRMISKSLRRQRCFGWF